MLLADLRGDEVDTVIDRIEAVIDAYPYQHEYKTWPGPNSNTFTAFVARRVPELRLDLPPTAIGKDYLGNGDLFGKAPSGTGYQFSAFGVFGIMAALEEGVELNLGGLVAGIDFASLAIKLHRALELGRQENAPKYGSVGIHRPSAFPAATPPPWNMAPLPIA